MVTTREGKDLDVVVMAVLQKVDLGGDVVDRVWHEFRSQIRGHSAHGEIFAGSGGSPTTQSAPSRRCAPLSFLQSSVHASTCTHFEICLSVRAMHATLGVPTSDASAVAWRLREERET